MDVDERPELDEFMRAVHVIRTASAQGLAERLVAEHGVEKQEAFDVAFDACGELLGRLFALLDGVGGPDGFPLIELTLDDGDSLNASPLHELFRLYSP